MPAALSHAQGPTALKEWGIFAAKADPVKGKRRPENTRWEYGVLRPSPEALEGVSRLQQRPRRECHTWQRQSPDWRYKSRSGERRSQGSGDPGYGFPAGVEAGAAATVFFIVSTIGMESQKLALRR